MQFEIACVEQMPEGEDHEDAEMIAEGNKVVQTSLTFCTVITVRC